MKTITICGKEYNIDCNALTYVKYKSFFKTGILQDMQFLQTYLIKQANLFDKLNSKKISDDEKNSQVARLMVEDTDEFITKITQIAWILIYTADKDIEEYEKWMENLTNFRVDDQWIAEVTEFAVSCFC